MALKLDLPTAHTSKPIFRAAAWSMTSRPSKIKAGFCVALGLRVRVRVRSRGFCVAIRV